MMFNVNHRVRVKLTDYGRALHMEEHMKFWRTTHLLNILNYVPPKEDAEGWSSWQLWNLMSVFGPHIAPARPLCFEPDIQLIQE